MMRAALWLLSNWRTVLVALLIAVPSGYAALLKHQRDAARAKIDAMIIEARVQDERTKDEIARQQAVTRETNDEHKKRSARLAADNARLRDELRAAARSVTVPAIPDAPSGGNDPVACFDRGLLNRELEGVLQRHAERLGAIAGEGEDLAAAYSAVARWAVEEAAKRK